MMIFPNTLSHIEKFLFCFAARPVVKLTQETFFIYILVYSKELVVETRNMAEVPLPQCLLLKLKPEIFPLTFRPTLFPSQTDKFSWRQICFIKEYVRR